MKMIYRKIISVWLASTFYLVIYIIVLPRFNSWNLGYLKGVGLLLLLQVMFVVPVTLTYGILISIIVEKIMDRFKKKLKESTYRASYISFHCFLGLLFGVILNNYYFIIIGTGLALLFSISDILLQSLSVSRRKTLYNTALMVSGILLILSIFPHISSK